MYVKILTGISLSICGIDPFRPYNFMSIPDTRKDILVFKRGILFYNGCLLPPGFRVMSCVPAHRMK
jgi:hypothetical protein